MSNPFHPLEIHPETREPFLRLAAPHEKIIITPPRIADIGPLVTILNDPRVYHWMTGPPVPYLPEHGMDWITDQIDETDVILRDLNGEGGGKAFALGCPVRIIRKVRDDGTEEYLGYVGLYRSERGDIVDEIERRAILGEDAKKEAGDPGIVWDLADYLKPSYHGMGIMSAAVATVINVWAVPRLNAHTIRASVLQGNAASVRVLEKVGFAVVKTVEAGEKVRGELRGVAWLEWTRAGQKNINK